MECHLCAEKESNYLARCCIKKCNKSYCLSCIRKQFNSVSSKIFRNSQWRCIKDRHGYAMDANRSVIVKNVQKGITMTKRQKKDQR